MRDRDSLPCETGTAEGEGDRRDLGRPKLKKNMTDNTDTDDATTSTPAANELTKLVAQMQHRAEQRKQAALARTVPTESTVPATRTDRPKRSDRNRGRPSTAVIEEAQLALFRLESTGRFVQQPLRPESEYPTFLTRLPIFLPARRKNQSKLLDVDNAMSFETPWGKGRKYGPPLTVYDEDTLIAIGRLRQSRLTGRPHNLPIPVPEVYQSKNRDDVSVHLVQCMLTDIQAMCGTTHGGKADQARLDSVKRLGGTVIEFTRQSPDLFVQPGTQIKLVDIAWQEYATNAILLIQFTPLMAHWFDNEYTYIDWDLRRKLSDTGKAVHRFLSSQPKDYEIGAKKLMTTIGFLRSYAEFMRDLRECLNQLKAEGWLRHYEVAGTGRKVPHKLLTVRA